MTRRLESLAAVMGRLKKSLPYGLAVLVVLLATGIAWGQIPVLPVSNILAAEPTVAMQPMGDGEMLWFGDDEAPVMIRPSQQTCLSGQPGCPTGAWGEPPRGPWHCQLLPSSLLYPAYLSANRESRLAGTWSYDRDHGWLWDVALGGHVGIVRFGDDHPVTPYGWQIDIEGAAFPRLDMESQRDMMATDYRFGVPLTMRLGAIEGKLAYYHLSSHLGDDYIFSHGGATPINYVRDSIVLAVAVRPVQDLRIYAEADFAVYINGGSRPWQFQFGVDWSGMEPDAMFGSPFFAVNGRIRQEVAYGGAISAQTGWQWRGEDGNLFRLGFLYFNGKSDSCQFFNEHEELMGVGAWYDF